MAPIALFRAPVEPFATVPLPTAKLPNRPTALPPHLAQKAADHATDAYRLGGF